MEKQKILVTGANGQLGSEIGVLAPSYPQYEFVFVTRETLPIEDTALLEKAFNEHQFAYFINCAAYTAVDLAEKEPEKAYLANAEAPGNAARICKQFGALFIHVSTDYVFNGQGTQPYKETDAVDPLGVYGASKLQGEQRVMEHNSSSMILRTSWVFSSFGKNFVKTMIRLMKDRDSINVVADQFGCPTYAADLAKAIIEIIADKDKQIPGIYNYCNDGVTTWFDFAKAIKEYTGSSCLVLPITTTEYPTPAKRPAYSVLDTTKIRSQLGITIPEWKKSLQDCLNIIRHASLREG
jgi:dTDP-4-dehydrorhamnose reductase